MCTENVSRDDDGNKQEFEFSDGNYCKSSSCAIQFQSVGNVLVVEFKPQFLAVIWHATLVGIVSLVLSKR